MFITQENLNTDVEIGLAGIDAGHHKVQYRGIPCAKSPFDYVLYQMILMDVKPDLIIEIGANEGGSALYLADLMELTGAGTIHAIDIADRVHPLARSHSRIQFFTEGWEAYNIDLAKDFKKVLVIEDSSHTYENTLAVLKRFAPLVTNGSYLIVEDGIIDALGRSEEFNGGPVRAIKEFLPAHPEFHLDTNWSDFFGKNTTFNPIGYLKKHTLPHAG